MIHLNPTHINPQKAELIGEMAGIFAGDGTLYTTNRGKGSVLEVRGNSDEIEYYGALTKKVKKGQNILWLFKLPGL